MEKLSFYNDRCSNQIAFHTNFGVDFTVDHSAPKEWIDEAFRKILKIGHFPEIPEGKSAYKNPSLFLPS